MSYLVEVVETIGPLSLGEGGWDRASGFIPDNHFITVDGDVLLTKIKIFLMTCGFLVSLYDVYSQDNRTLLLVQNTDGRRADRDVWSAFKRLSEIDAGWLDRIGDPEIAVLFRLCLP